MSREGALHGSLNSKTAKALIGFDTGCKNSHSAKDIQDGYHIKQFKLMREIKFRGFSVQILSSVSIAYYS